MESIIKILPTNKSPCFTSELANGYFLASGSFVECICQSELSFCLGGLYRSLESSFSAAALSWTLRCEFQLPHLPAILSSLPRTCWIDVGLFHGPQLDISLDSQLSFHLFTVSFTARSNVLVTYCFHRSYPFW